VKDLQVSQVTRSGSTDFYLLGEPLKRSFKNPAIGGAPVEIEEDDFQRAAVLRQRRHQPPGVRRNSTVAVEHPADVDADPHLSDLIPAGTLPAQTLEVLQQSFSRPARQPAVVQSGRNLALCALE
jgi:hypothetical protein